ncbi:kinase-like protein [Hymenopellis radicata]|nr:kinase-like protein [Hymenopellis radicata]
MKISLHHLSTKKFDSAMAKPRTLPVNRLLRYKWKATVGAGAFGRVQLVRSLHDGHCYAIKTMKKTRVIELSEVFQDSENLYMVMEYVPGGELFTLLRDCGKFTEKQARFYLCEILMALVFLHELKIMYRDLKTENILIGRDGHIKLADFGLAKPLHIFEITSRNAGLHRPRSKEYNHSVDYYSFGVLVYELLVGTTPYHISGVHFPDAKARSTPYWPSVDILRPLAKALVVSLMCIHPKRRLGNKARGVSEILEHPWFKRIDWRPVQHRMTQPPYIPRLQATTTLAREERQNGTTWKHFPDFPYVGASAKSLRWI